MSQTNVSSCVLSIVASFTSGLDVLKRLSKHGHSKRLKRSHNASLENEVRLRRSLQQGPEEIGREYQRGLHAAGNQQEHFARGDSLAQNTLAEILLKLNTGLVAIINTFLSKGKQDAPLDYSSLTDLSERSRQDTCRTLRKLYQRMRIGLPKRFGNEQAHRRAEPRSRSNVSRASRTNCDNEAKMKGAKVRGPMLARVVVANSSRPSVVAMVRPAEGRKTSASSTASSRSQLNALPTSPIRSAYLPHSLSTQRSRAAITAPRNKGSATELDTSKPSQNVNSLQKVRSAPRLLHPTMETPAMVESNGFALRSRKPTPTYYSAETTSTKIGEIPMCKWAEPYDFEAMSMLNAQAAASGWPIADLDSVQAKRKKGGLFRLFRKKGLES